MLRLPSYPATERKTFKSLKLSLSADGHLALLRLRQHLGGVDPSRSIEAALVHTISTLKIPVALV